MRIASGEFFGNPGRRCPGVLYGREGRSEFVTQSLNCPTRRTKHGMISDVPPFLLSPWAAITMSSHRIERVSELVKREVSEVVQGLNLTDCGFITITAAEINPDLKDGRIYLSVIGSAEQKQRALDVLERQHGHIQHELARRIVLK